MIQSNNDLYIGGGLFDNKIVKYNQMNEKIKNYRVTGEVSGLIIRNKNELLYTTNQSCLEDYVKCY